jgi:hypothetical protein
MHATAVQFLSTKFGFIAGKIFTLDGLAGESPATSGRSSSAPAWSSR